MCACRIPASISLHGPKARNADPVINSGNIPSDNDLDRSIGLRGNTCGVDKVAARAVNLRVCARETVNPRVDAV